MPSNAAIINYTIIDDPIAKSIIDKFIRKCPKNISYLNRLATELDIIIKKKNEVYLKLECEPHIIYELAPYFEFEIPSAKFMKRGRYQNWDGKRHKTPDEYQDFQLQGKEPEA